MRAPFILTQRENAPVRGARKNKGFENNGNGQTKPAGRVPESGEKN